MSSREGPLSAAWMSALLSSSSRAVSRWPFWADTIRAVLPSCGHARRGGGRRARDRGVGGRQGSWRACAYMSACVAGEVGGGRGNERYGA